MMTDSETPPTTPLRRVVPPRDFRTTQWTQVCLAKADSDEGRRALSDLCDAYYDPVAAYVRCRLRDADAAQEMTQAFFAHVLSGDAFVHAERGLGRFRSYLLGAVKHFVAHQREAAARLKRGGGLEWLSIHDDESGAQLLPDEKVLSPDVAFDRQWALTVLARAMDTLQAECSTEGRAGFFDRVKPWLMGEAAHGDQAELAVECGMNAATLRVAVHRLKQRFRQLVKAEVACTLDDPRMVEEEMRMLFTALGG